MLVKWDDDPDWAHNFGVGSWTTNQLFWGRVGLAGAMFLDAAMHFFGDIQNGLATSGWTVLALFPQRTRMWTCWGWTCDHVTFPPCTVQAGSDSEVCYNCLETRWVGPMVQWTRKNHKIGFLAKFPLNQNCDLLGCFRRLLPQTEELPSIALAMDSCTMVESIFVHHTHLCWEFLVQTSHFTTGFKDKLPGLLKWGRSKSQWLRCSPAGLSPGLTPRCHPQRLEPWFAACA